jgi:hypothetical protein
MKKMGSKTRFPKPHKAIGGGPLLPNRGAVHKLTGKGLGFGGASMMDYAAATPSGAGAQATTYPQIIAQGQDGADIEPDV